MDPGLDRLLNEGRWTEAEGRAREDVAAAPRDAAAWSALGRVLFTAGRMDQLDEARVCLERATDLDPGRASAWYWLGRANGQAAGQGGMMHRAQMATKSGDCFARAVELEPDRFEYTWALLRFNLQAPSLVGGDRAAARTLASKFDEEQPDERRLLTAAVELKSGTPVRTLDLLRSVEGTETESLVVAWGATAIELGEQLLRGEEWPEAAELYLMVTERLPEERTAWYGLGRALEGKGDPGGATEAYREALERLPDGPRADAIRKHLSELER